MLLNTFKITLLIFSLFMASCSQGNLGSSEKNDTGSSYRDVLTELQKNYTPTEVALNLCMQSKAITCLDNNYECLLKNKSFCQSKIAPGYSKEKNIQVSNLSKRELASYSSQRVQLDSLGNVNLQAYDWFFLNPLKIKRLLNFFEKVKQTTDQIADGIGNTALDQMHGHGVGVLASAYLGEGTSLGIEAMVFDRKLSLFCAPGINYVSDIGVQVGLHKTQTFACKDSESYKGQFVSVGAGVSFTNFAIPLAVDIAYSFGMNTNTLKEHLIRLRVDNIKLLAELALLPQALKEYGLSQGFSNIETRALSILGQIAAKSLGETNSINFDNELSSELDLTNFLKNQSLGNLIKKIISAREFNHFLDTLKLRESKKFFYSIEKSLSGCDAMSGALSIALAALPVNATLGTSYFTRLGEVDLESLYSLSELSVFTLMNPIFMDKETAIKVVKMALFLEPIPRRIVNKCYNEEFNDLHGEFSLARHFLSN